MNDLGGQDPVGGLEIAVVGMAGRFPGARNVAEFWRNLRDGVESVSFFSEAEALADGAPPADLRRPEYVRAGGVLEEADRFDAAHFGFYPREAEILDPQQRVFLECAWEALEDAGCDPARYPGAIGVYAGCGLNTYLLLHLLHNREIRDTVHPYQLTLGNEKDFLATRVAYKLGLKGPAVTVQTACSTSLVAVHYACQGLLNAQCDLALAGGVSIRLPQRQGYLHQAGGIASADGHCRAFDADATGTVGGNGVGIVVLKRLADALADGDTIRAVILGSAVNNDGALKVGYTAPSVEGQAEVIATAQYLAGVTPDSVQYVEAHGTGTPIGDPIEVAALRQAFGAGGTLAEGSVALGSVKSNVGHLDAAAGVAGLIKTVLALEHGELPPSLHFTRPNPKLELEGSPFTVNDRLRPWPRGADPRRAGVSSFGIGGTNAHVVLQEPPVPVPDPSRRPAQLYVLSARTPEALDAASERLAARLAGAADEPADVAFTLQTGRRAFPHRRIVVARDLASAAAALVARDARVRSGHAGRDGRGVVFMFTGQGAQYPGMARGLYRTEPVYREAVDTCAELLRNDLGLDLRELLHPADGCEAEARRLLDETRYTQPALFAVEYALAQVWRRWGVEPEAMIGHSIGEYVAACLAGVFPLEDALRIVAARGRLMQSLPGGAMLGVNLEPDAATRLLGDDVDLAAVNAPGACTVSGSFEAIERAEAALTAAGVSFRRLRTSHAFHSRMMTPILEAFGAEVAAAHPLPPRLPFVSNVTGTWITAAEATDPGYWASHLRGAVRFADGIATLLAGGERVLLEVGPGKTLATLARMQVAPGSSHAIATSLREPTREAEDFDELLGALGQLWTAGVAVDWAALHAGERRRRVPLPTYPFERRRFWIEPDGTPAAVSPARPDARRADPAEWIHRLVWRRDGVPAGDPAGRRWLVAGPAASLAGALRRHLASLGAEVVAVGPGDGDGGYAVRDGDADGWASLFATLARHDRLPDVVVQVVAGGPGRGAPAGESSDDAGPLRAALALVQGMTRGAPGVRCDLALVTADAQDVTGEEPLDPAAAMLDALCRVVPQEWPGIRSRTVDVTAAADPAALVPRLAAELASGGAGVALRGGYRWVRRVEPVAPGGAAIALREEGVYLVTGGLGRLGLLWAGYLTRRARARLVLVSRRALPPRESWAARIAAEPASAESDLLGRLLALETAGAVIEVVAADVSDPAAMAGAVARAEQRFGRLDGVVHCAGTVGHAAVRALAETGEADLERQLAAKVRGTRALAAALGDRRPDFVLLQSSLASELGGVGFGAYAAANRFLDVFAEARERSAAGWCSIAWDGWRFDEDARGAAARALEAAIRPDEADAAFDAVLAAGGARLLVSTTDLAVRATRAAAAAGSADEVPAEVETPAAARHARPNLPVAYTAPRTPLESEIVAAWERVLGIAGIGVHDDFFELGGHSLLATQLVSRLRQTFGVELPLARLFETPTPAGLAALVEEARGAGAATAVAIEPIPRDGTLPLSFAQQRLWFLDQLEPGSPLYNNPAAVRLTGRLELAALESSVAAIIARHEVLRTGFADLGGTPRATVHPDVRVPLPVEDLEGLPAAERDAAVARRAAEEAVRPFDLSAPPLLRVVLLRLAPEEHVVLLTMHHIVSDGWSVAVLVRELGALYAATVAGASAPLPPLAIQYADFAAWQRNHLTGAELERQLAYWTRELADGPPVLELPFDRPRGAVQDSAGAVRRLRLPADLVAALRGLAQREDATLFMVLLAAFQTLLHRLAGQDVVQVGTPIAGRTRAETEGLIGFFVNTLVMRAEFTGDPTFRELLARVRASALGAYEHQELPFEQVVDALQPERDLRHTPLFQAMFTLQNTPPLALELAGLRMERLETGSGTAKFDLSLTLEEEGGEVRGVVEYGTALFDGESIDRLIARFERVLRGVTADPDRRVSAVPLLAPEEELALLEWGCGRAVEPASPFVADAIVAQAGRTPDAPAVESAGQVLSYGELDRRSAALAGWLREQGAGPGAVVGVCLERGLELPVALLAILRAGATYLPLDPAYPAERTAFMLEDSGARLVLTQARLAPGIPATAGVVPLDADPGGFAAAPFAGPVPGTPADPAYLIYTSGSTGRPKGVLVSQAALAAHVEDVRDHFGLTPADRVLQFAALNFDPSIEQMLPTLAAGACLVLRDEEPWLPDEFSARVAALGLTVVNLPPAYWQQWVRAGIPAPSALRLVIVGGDLLPYDAVRAWLDSPAAGVRLLNAYGPTETVITAATYEVPRGFQSPFRRVPVGRPLANRRFYVLDAAGRPAAPGVAGELWIGGTALATGYLGRPGLTAERFVADPFAGGPDARMYRTGDRVRWRPDGQLEFLGRTDAQVKLRGFRIEPGEIEAVLATHPAVRDAVVLAREDAGEKRLIAWVVGDGTADPGELRRWLLERLPDYMVPAAFVPLDALPLTPGGKVDRRALPAPDADALAARAAYVAPRTPVEQQLAAMFAEVLGVERVGIHDGFFELGGHSLLATQLVSRLRQAFPVELPLREMFQQPTVAGLATLIAQQLAGQEDAGELASLMLELEGLSDAEVRALLAEETGEGT